MGSTVHVSPINDLIEHDTDTGQADCICGPMVEHVPSEGGDGWIILHHSLDGREERE